MQNRAALAGVLGASIIVASGSGCSPAAPTRIQRTGLPIQTISVSGVVTEPGAGPVAGASIRVGTNATVTSDASGAFVLPAVEFTDGLSFSVTKEGFDALVRSLSVSTANLTIRLQRSLFLPNEGMLSANLYSDDTAGYVGEAYESDYCSNCKTIHFETPGDTDVNVVLRWSGSATLQMWALDGSVVDAPDADTTRRSIRLPRGRIGTLIVGRRYGSAPLAAPVPFTLSAAPGSH